MVQSTEPTSSESAPSPETVETLPASGDDPLIPTDFVETIGTPDTATDETATSDEAPSDDSGTDSQEPPETTEEAPAAVTTETPEATPTETAPAEGETPTPRTYTAEEWGNRESSYRTRDTEQLTEVTALRAEVAQIRNDSQNALLDATANGYVSGMSTRYQNSGMGEQEANDLAANQIEAAKADWRNQQEVQRLRGQVQQVQQSELATATRASVDHLMQEHGVPEAKRPLLLGLTDPALAVELAKDLGAAEVQRKQAITAKQAEVPAGGDSNKFDAGTGGSTSDTDADWLARWTAPNGTMPSSPENIARAVKIAAKEGWTP